MVHIFLIKLQEVVLTEMLFLRLQQELGLKQMNQNMIITMQGTTVRTKKTLLSQLALILSLTIVISHIQD